MFIVYCIDVINVFTGGRDQLKAQLSNRERELQYMRELLQKTEREKFKLLTQNKEMEVQHEELKKKQLEEEKSRTEFAQPIVSPRMRPLVSEDNPQFDVGVWPNNHMNTIRRDYDVLNRKMKELEGKLDTEQNQRQKVVNGYNKVSTDRI